MTTSADIRARLAAHQAKRPDHKEAMRPDAPKEVRAAFTTWCDEKRVLVDQLEACLTHERGRWCDANGNPIKPHPWQGGMSDVHRLQERKVTHHQEGGDHDELL